MRTKRRHLLGPLAQGCLDLGKLAAAAAGTPDTLPAMPGSILADSGVPLHA